MGEVNEKTLRFDSLRDLSEYLEQTEDEVVVSVIIESGVGQNEEGV